MSPDEQDRLAVCLDAAGFACDAAVLDRLARLALELRRAGYRLVLRNPPPELVELIDLSGLSQTLPAASLRPGSTPPRC